MTNNLPIRTALALTLVISAIAATATAASARYDQESSPPAQSQTANPRPEVHSNPDQQVAQVSQVGPPTLHSATASQLPAVKRHEAAASHALAYKPTQVAPYSSAGLNGHVSSPTNGVSPVVHVTTHSNPFDWGDAAIGAAGGLVISLLIVGGTFVITQRRHPKTSRAKALA